MNHNKHDEPARVLAHALSRRKMLKLMGGTMLVPLLGFRGLQSLFDEQVAAPNPRSHPVALPPLAPGSDICGTIDDAPVDAVRNGSPQEMAKFKDLASHVSASPNKKTIKVAFHVISYSTPGGVVDATANVTDAQVAEQMHVINSAFAPCGLQFPLVQLDRTVNDDWRLLELNSGDEREMMRTLAVDPAHNLNIYCLEMEQRYLGWARFPWNSKKEDDYMQGVVIQWVSLPGVIQSILGYQWLYGYGLTAVHEMGHYLGLFHTFQDGCAEPGDYCDDTPAQATPSPYNCDGGRDTCASSGNDPIHNYMDYSSDSCRTQFTRDQIARMYWALATYRPSLTT